uniref:Uncharacterized protein n=1 Tax=Fusarium temperatum TaxID=767483 RepID=A0A0U2D7H9_9HYPO|nr:hypothetical protein [Fusarium temperatum]
MLFFDARALTSLSYSDKYAKVCYKLGDSYYYEWSKAVKIANNLLNIAPILPRAGKTGLSQCCELMGREYQNYAAVAYNNSTFFDQQYNHLINYSMDIRESRAIGEIMWE